MKNVLFLHGFNSSPQSLKAQQTQQYLKQYFPQVKFHCPQLALTPDKVIKQLTPYFTEIKGGSKLQSWGIIGSSLGGYFATYLSETYAIKAVLINPAIKPYELIANYIGEQINPYTQEVYQIKPCYLEDLIALEQHHITKNNYMVMVQTGDEVLNYQQAVEKFHASTLIVQPNGDHSFVNYKAMLPTVVEFLQLNG